jgi:pimeloyl-ACP methyl ester carboxylesterase
MNVDWDVREAGPPDAEYTVLLLPGGSCSAGSYAEVMAEPALAEMRLIAATLPGNAGAPPPDDYSVENYARFTAELASEVGADVVVGFSYGGNVAIEMIISGAFTGPAVLLEDAVMSRPSLVSGRTPATARASTHPAPATAKRARLCGLNIVVEDLTAIRELRRHSTYRSCTDSGWRSMIRLESGLARPDPEL